MKRTTLWTNRSIGLIVSAAALAAVAAGSIMFSSAAVGQAAEEHDRQQRALSRREVSELLAKAREAIGQGRLDEAEAVLVRAEQAGVDYPLFYPGATPRKVRKELEAARQASRQAGQSSLPNPLTAFGGAQEGSVADPFANRERTQPGAPARTALPGSDAYQTTSPEPVHMPTPPPIDSRMGHAAADLVAASGQSGGRYGESRLSGGGAPPANSPLDRSSAAARSAARASLHAARMALAVGDTQRARAYVAEAKKLNVSFPPGQDGIGSVEAEIVRFEQLMTERQALGGDPAWRRQYGGILCEQAAALVDYGELEEAERLVTDAADLGVSYGPYDINPQQVMQKIAQAKEPPAAAGALAQNAAGAPPATSAENSAASKERVLRLLAAARAALAAGDIGQAEELAGEAHAIGVPQEQFAAGEDRPVYVTLDIQKAKIARAQRQAGPGSALPSERPQLALEVQQSLYTPETDPTRNETTSGNELADGMPQFAQNEASPATVPAAAASPVESEAARLLAEGEAALRSGDKESALQLFQDAYKQRDGLDPITAERLQGHLQMLSSANLPAPSATDGSLIDAANQNEQVLLRQLSAELTRRQSDARRLRDSDPKQALTVLEESRESIRNASISQAAKTQLLRRVDLSVAETEDYIEQNRAQFELDAANREVLEEVERRRQARLDMQQRIAELVDEFNKLQEEQRYEEMEIVAQRLYELAPEEPVAQTAWTTAKMYRRAKLNQMLSAEKEEGVWNELYQVERSLVPFDDNNPFQYGHSPHGWEQLRNLRGEGRQRNRLNERELEIQRKLRMPVQVSYVDRPLQDVINELQRIAGINIHLDEYGLGQEAVGTDTPVTLPLQNEISLKSVLNLILEPLHLDYVIEDEVLKITSEQRAQGAVYSQVYDVADLVIPIPNFTPSSNIGLQGLISDAHAAAGGHWLGGPSPVALVNDDPRKGGTTLASREVMGQQLSGIAGIPGSNSPTVPISSGPGGLGGGSLADFDSLITLITTTVHAESWDQVGGPGSIQPFPTNLSLVISQTQEVHEEIADLLEQLRRLQDLQVTIEVRFITLSDSFFEQIGVDFDFLIEDGPGVIPELAPGPGNPVPGQRVEGQHRSATVGLLPAAAAEDFPNFTADLDVPFTQESFALISPQFGTPVNVAQFGFAILSDLEAYFVVQAAQGDRRSNVLEAPKVTLFNGQQAFVTDSAQRPFVVSVIPVVGDFAAAQQPVIVVLSEGTMLSIQAVVSDDRRYVRLTVVPFFSQIGQVEEFTFEGSTTSTSGSSSVDDDDDGTDEEESSNSTEVRTGTTVQLPTFEIISVATTVSVPDGGTVLLGGIKRLSEGRNEFGVPLLSKIPYINRLFRNVGIGRQTQSLMMMVTPRIIIQEEEEAKLLGTQVGP